MKVPDTLKKKPPRTDRNPSSSGARSRKATGLGRLIKRTVAEFNEGNLTDWAAALTYYGLLSLFPALIALASILGLIGDPRTTTAKITEVITGIGPKSAAQTFAGPIRTIATNQSAAGFAFVVGLALAVWSGSGYVGAFIRASNLIYERSEGRSFWKLRPLQMVMTLAMIILVALLALGLVLTGPMVAAVAKPLGVSSAGVEVWSIAKWPVMVVVFLVMVGVLYYASPNVKIRGFRWVTPGSLIAIVIWALASAGFAVYVANFSSYDKTYGTLAGVIVLLIWLWISNVAILFGHQFNAEIERSIELGEGQSEAERQLQLEPRARPR